MGKSQPGKLFDIPEHLIEAAEDEAMRRSLLEFDPTDLLVVDFLEQLQTHADLWQIFANLPLAQVCDLLLCNSQYQAFFRSDFEADFNTYNDLSQAVPIDKKYKGDRRRGVTSSRILAFIAEHPKCRVRDIRQALDLSAAGVSSQLTNLVKADLVCYKGKDRHRRYSIKQ